MGFLMASGKVVIYFQTRDRYAEFLKGRLGLDGSHPYAGVHNTAALSGRHGKDRIQVKLGDFVDLFDETRYAEENLFDRFDIGWGMASVSFKETIAFDLANHVAGIAIGQRRDAKAHVAEDLHMDAAEAKRDERAEKRVLCHADQ